MQLYKNESSNPKTNAQRNLCGRTYYVDDDTLRFHKSRIISARPTDSGLLFAIVTSDALDYENRRRGFRYVIFDVFGTVVSRCRLEDARRTSEQATKDMWREIDKINADAVTRTGIDNARKHFDMDVARLERDLATICDGVVHK